MVDSKISEMFRLPARYIEQTNIWNDYANLAREYNPINLGQGFPDFIPSSSIVRVFDDIVQSNDASLHQYTRGCGHPRLVEVLGSLYSVLMKRKINPYDNILICSGGCATLNSVITGTVQKGDEVIVIDPSFDCYTTMVQAVGGIVTYVPLRLKTISNPEITSADWVLDFKELENTFNKYTKVMILNTPHNPFGKVFSMEELSQIADLCKKWDVICISDEVYEWQVFEPKDHIRIATLKDMWERCITIGSAGKTFCVTGWKVGWAVGPTHLMNKLQNEHVFYSNTIQQEAVAIVLEEEMAKINTNDSYFKNLKHLLQSKKSYVVQFLKEVGMKPIVPEGGIFVVADWTPLENRVNLFEENDDYKDFRFSKWFAKNVGVLGIPASTFFSRQNKNIGEDFIRFCFIKVSMSLCFAVVTHLLQKKEKLEDAANALKKWILEK